MEEFPIAINLKKIEAIETSGDRVTLIFKNGERVELAINDVGDVVELKRQIEQQD